MISHLSPTPPRSFLPSLDFLHHYHYSNSHFRPSTKLNYLSPQNTKSNSHFHPSTFSKYISPQNTKSNPHFHPFTKPNYLSPQYVPNPYPNSNYQFHPSRTPNHVSAQTIKTGSHFHPSRKPQNLISHYHKPNSHFHPPTKENSVSDPKTSPKSLTPEYTPITVIETLHSYANDWKRGLEFFNWLQTQPGFQHTTETYNKIIDILGKVFEFDICWELIQRMRKSEGSLPNHQTIRTMFKRYVCAHLVNEAIHMFDSKLDEFGLKDRVSFINLIDALCEYKHVGDAEELLFRDTYRVIKACGFDVCLDTKIYNMILRGWYKVGHKGKCREYWSEMDRKGVEKDLYSYSIFMDIACKNGNPSKAIVLYKEMKRRGIALDVVAYNTVIRAIGERDGVDVAVRMLKEMVESRCQPNVVTYNTMLKLYCDHGRYRDVYDMLNDMCNKGCEPNALTFHSIFASSGKPKEIMQLFERMIENGIRPHMDTYVMLMKKYGRWGFLRPVLSVWKKMEEHGVSPDEVAYNVLIDVLVQKGLIDMARKYDQEMFKKGLSPKPRSELETMPLLATVTGS